MNVVARAADQSPTDRVEYWNSVVSEAFVPLARIKHEHDKVRVPYSTQHIQKSPEVEAGEELSQGDDQALRAYYSIGFADQELRTDNESYANQVPEEEGTLQQVERD